MATPRGGISVSVELDAKAMARADRRLAAYMGRPLQARARKAYLEGARLMVTPMRRDARAMFVGRHDRAKRTVNAIRARNSRLRPGEMAVASVGPATPLRFIVVRGTAPHTLAPKRAGKGAFVTIPIDARGAGGFGPRRVRVIPGHLVNHPGGSARPFVDRTFQAMGARVQDFIADRTLAVTGETFRSY